MFLNVTDRRAVKPVKEVTKLNILNTPFNSRIETPPKFQKYPHDFSLAETDRYGNFENIENSRIFEQYFSCNEKNGYHRKSVIEFLGRIID